MTMTQLLDARPNLTGRECEILECVAMGMSAKEVARHIELAPRTVERHIENIRLKMHARNSAHMIACAIYYGLISLPTASKGANEGTRTPDTRMMMTQIDFMLRG